MKKDLFVNLKLLIISLIASLIFFEMIIRLFSLSQTKRSYNRIVRQKYRQLRQWNNKDNIHELKPKFQIAIDNIPVVINSDGFRDYEYSLEKKEGVFRIACLGDSVTFGFGVALEDTYPKVLERSLLSVDESIQVINFGVFGYNASENIWNFYNRASRYKPNLVILQFGLNDIGKDNDGMPSKEIPKEKKTSFIEKLKKICRKSALYLFLAERYNYVALKMGIRGKTFFDEYDYSDEVWNKLFLDLENFVSDLEAQDIKVALVFFPYAYQIYSNRDEIWLAQRRLAEFCYSHNILFIDLTIAFKEAHSVLRPIFLDDCHLSPKGHQIAAEHIKRNLELEGVIDY